MLVDIDIIMRVFMKSSRTKVSMQALWEQPQLKVPIKSLREFSPYYLSLS